jgi:hypothetical protein
MNLSPVIEEIKKRQAENKITLATFEKVCNLLGKFEEKEITKRVETFLKSETDFSFSFYRPEYDFEKFKIYVWSEKNGLKYENRLCLYLGRGNDPYFKMEWFLNENKAYTNMKKFLEDTEKELQDMETLQILETLANEIKEKRNMFSEICGKLPHNYVLQELLK